MPKNKSIIRQVKEALDQKLRIGEKKHPAKQAGIASDGIYSWGTYNTYLAKSCNFVKWAKEYHENNGDINDGSNDDVNDDNNDDSNSDGNGGSNSNSNSNSDIKSRCRTLADVRKYVNPYIQHLIEQGYAPSTQKTIASALAKLYGCSTKDFIPTQDRRRADITRSRLGKANEGFSEE